MTASSVLAAIFHPPSGPSPAERLVSESRQAAACDLAFMLEALGLDVVVLAPGSEAGVLAAERPLIRTDGDDPFHFGASLKRLVRERRPQGLLVFGSGSGNLLSTEQLGNLCRFADGPAPAAVFNNFYSCDFAAIAQADRLLGLDLPATDNPLGLALADAGLRCQTMTRTAATQFDVDTPADVHVLARSGRGGASVRASLDSVSGSHPTLEAVLASLTDRSAVVSLIGRLSPKTWSDVESRIACRTSALVEGRGMQSHGRKGAPILNQVLEENGPRTFFRRLAESSDAAIIDSRPLLRGQENAQPSAADRFACDLFQPERIEDPRWAEFAAEAADAAIPVLLGGHSIVSGGLYLMAEVCWNGRDLERRLHPDLFESDKEQP